jgi:amidase
MARNAADLRLALHIISGPDGRDSSVPLFPWQDVSRPALNTLRIAWTPTFPDMPIASAIRTAIEQLALTLGQQGARVEQCLPHVDYVQQSRFVEGLFALIASAFQPRSEHAPPVFLDDYFMALHQRDRFIMEWEHFFTHWDVFLCPAGAMTAPRYDGPELKLDGTPLAPEQLPLLNLPYALSPVTGCPAIVMPLAQDQQGLPFGVQIMGPRWSDERLLAIAEVLSEFTGGFRRPPGY